MRSASLLPLLALLACGDEGEEGPIPTLTFLSPEEGEVISGDTVQVSILVEDFSLVAAEAARSPSPQPMGPLLLLAIPSARAHSAEGELAEGFCRLTLDGVDVADLDSTQFELTGVAPGAHSLEGQLFFADGDAYEPVVVASVSFTTGA